MAETSKSSLPVPSHPTILRFPAPPPPGSRTPSSSPEPWQPARVGDAVDLVRGAIGELEGARGPSAAARVCAAALVSAVGARAVVVHAHYPRAKKIQIVAAVGWGTASLVGATARTDDDVIASVVVATAASTTLVIDAAAGLAPRLPERLMTIGAERKVVAVPAIVKGRVGAILEIVDPSEGVSDAAADFTASELARFLAAQRSR